MKIILLWFNDCSALFINTDWYVVCDVHVTIVNMYL